MELILSLAIGILTASGVWLLLRPRTFQVVVGMLLLSYAVNLFLLASGGLRGLLAPILGIGSATAGAANPVPQALVLTAIVIGFATTALLLVVLITLRGLVGNDHVDGEDGKP